MKAARDFAVVGLGELLWDELPAGRRLGGAPANFAVMAARLGAHGIIASRLGEDEPGTAARALLGTLPADARFLQIDGERTTGTVSVAIEAGQPRYTIHAPVAWDALALTPAWLELAGRADAVCWGTLAQRSAISAETIHGFLAATRQDCLRIFDVNLRAPFFTAEAVTRSLARATLLKLNESEMPQLLALAGLPAAKEDRGSGRPGALTRSEALTMNARQLLSAYKTIELVAITLGAEGSLLITRSTVLSHPGVQATVADTVGAGDAFTAALAVSTLRGESLAVRSEAANRWGAWVASQSGAMPEFSRETASRIAQQIHDAASQIPVSGRTVE